MTASGDTVSASAALPAEDGEEELLLAAYDEAVERLAADIAVACRGRQGDWRISVWAAISAGLSFFAAHPTSARAILIDAPGGGEAVVARHRASLRRLEALLRERRRRDAYAKALSPFVEQVVVGGIHSACAECLLSEGAARLPEFAPQLTEAALTPYVGPRRAAAAVRAGEQLNERVRFVHETAGMLRPLPVGPHRIPRDEVRADQRQRLFVAVAELLAERGIAGVPIDLLVERARVSKVTFYENFSDVSECLLAAYEDTECRLRLVIETAAAKHPDWDSRVSAAVFAVLDFFSSRPSLVYLFDVEGRAADAELARRRHRSLELLANGLKVARRTRAAARLPKLVERILIEGGLVLIRLKIEAGEAARLPALEDELTEWLLTASRLGSSERD